MFHKKNISLLVLLCLKPSQINTMNPGKLDISISYNAHPELFKLCYYITKDVFPKEDIEGKPGLSTKINQHLVDHHPYLVDHPSFMFRLEIRNKLYSGTRETIISSHLSKKTDNNKPPYTYYVNLTLSNEQNEIIAHKYAYQQGTNKRIKNQKIKIKKSGLKIKDLKELLEKTEKLNNQLTQKKKTYA